MTPIKAAHATTLPKIHSHWSEVGSVFDRSPPRLQPVVPDSASSPAPDSNLVALVERFEALLRDYIEAHLHWVPCSRKARAEVDRVKPLDWWDLPPEPRQKLNETCARIFERTGCSAASDRVRDLHDQLEPLARLIGKEKASTLAGLRARTLFLLFEAMPVSADEDKLQFDEQGAQEAASSLLLAAAELTGFAPLVRDTERQLAALGPCEDEDDEEGEQ
jgi:hypothetical protein